MTREEALAGHRKLWNEIADMIESGVRTSSIAYKYLALKNLKEERDIFLICYLCEYIYGNNENLNCPTHCPVVWGDTGCNNNRAEHKLFNRAISYEDYTSAAILARTIANLPERVVE